MPKTRIGSSKKFKDIVYAVLGLYPIEDIKHLIEEMKKEKIGRKPAWDKFVEVVTKAIEDILKDNEE